MEPTVVYHAVFMFEDDGSCSIVFPSLHGLFTVGRNFLDGLSMAKEALAFYFEGDDSGEPIGDTIKECVRQFENTSKNFDDDYEQHIAFVPVEYLKGWVHDSNEVF